MRSERVYDLEERLLHFAARVIRLAERLPNTKAGGHVARQLIRSATAPMAHHGEAQAAESRRDFVHKMRMAHKELCESLRWIRLALLVPLLPDPEEGELILKETNELVRIFNASIRTASSGADVGD